MAKNLFVTLTGYAGETKQTKAGGSYVTVPVPVVKRLESGEYEVLEKHYFNIFLDEGVSVEKDGFFEITGELRISKYTNDKDELVVTFWVNNAAFKSLAKPGNPNAGRTNLEAFGAAEIAPF
jgi:hypothetical protein